MILGNKTFLRPVVPTDAALLLKWENDPSVWAVSGTKKPYTKKEIHHFIKDQKDIYLDKQLRLMICVAAKEKKAKAVAGCIDLFDFDNKKDRAGIGIYIEKKHREKGIAADALEALAGYCFDILHLRHLDCSIPNTNLPSLALFRKCGFKKIKRAKGITSLTLTLSKGV